jgi:hypothetical protein
MVGSLSSSGVLSTYLTLSCLGYDVIRSALNQTIKASLYLEKRLKEELNDQIRIYNHVEMNN